MLFYEKEPRGRRNMKYWEIIADNLKKAGRNWGCVSALDREGRTIWVTEAHRDGKRFVVHADAKLIAFPGLAAAVQPGSQYKSETVTRAPQGQCSYERCTKV